VTPIYLRIALALGCALIVYCNGEIAVRRIRKRTRCLPIAFLATGACVVWSIMLVHALLGTEPRW
jgi:hypothetical protein